MHNSKSLYHANVRKHVTVPEKASQKFTVPGYPKHTESSLKLSSEKDACVFRYEEQGTVTHSYLPEIFISVVNETVFAETPTLCALSQLIR